MLLQSIRLEASIFKEWEGGQQQGKRTAVKWSGFWQAAACSDMGSEQEVEENWNGGDERDHKCTPSELNKKRWTENSC